MVSIYPTPLTISDSAAIARMPILLLLSRVKSDDAKYHSCRRDNDRCPARSPHKESATATANSPTASSTIPCPLATVGSDATPHSHSNSNFSASIPIPTRKQFIQKRSTRSRSFGRLHKEMRKIAQINIAPASQKMTAAIFTYSAKPLDPKSSSRPSRHKNHDGTPAKNIMATKNVPIMMFPAR